MNDLRQQIHDVFARQQTQLGDVSDSSNRMLRAATGGRRVNRQMWPSMAGVALVLVAATAVATSVVIRGLHPRPSTTTRPTPSASATTVPTPMSRALQVPSTTPVILFHDPVDFNQVDGTTWDGSAKGRVVVGSEVGMGFVQNPVGTLLGGTGYIRDRTGALVASPPVNTKGFAGTWADDGRHYCSMLSKSAAPPAGGEPTTLQVTAVGQAPTNIVQVGRVYDQTSVGVAACSIEKDLAVAVQSGSSGNTVQFWVVQLSTGRILWTRPSLGDIRSSRDGQYIAEVSYSQAAPSATTIYGPRGAVLGHLTGRVEAFSWDGSLAVQMTDYGGPVSIVRWRDGTVVWKGPSDGGFLAALPEPGGQRIAISVRDPKYPQTGGFPPGDIYVVSPDGQAVELLTNVMQ
ncbi:MAG TPA: hypothetical protein VGR77_01475 [Candidatus Dormibacteraeota bacterium]|nr:hypothetical protein [Candidatus Dormibacteraeota bacterium]